MSIRLEYDYKIYHIYRLMVTGHLTVRSHFYKNIFCLCTAIIPRSGRMNEPTMTHMILLLTLATATLLATPLFAATPKTIVIGTDNGYKPCCYLDENGKHS